MMISLDYSIKEVVVDLAKGNPGAVVVCLQLLEQGLYPNESVDLLLSLSKLEIYGPDIWRLYKDICDQNIQDMALVLQARTRGLLAKEEIREALDRADTYQPHGLDLASLRTLRTLLI